MMRSIYGYVSMHERTRFFAYALRSGFKASEVAKFLVLRELQLQRLRRLKDSVAFPHSSNGNKVTAHLPSTVQRRFVRHVKLLHLSPSVGLAILIRQELRERSLLKALRS